MDISQIVPCLRAAGCVFAEDEADLLVLAARTPQELAAMVGQRVSGMPLEHVLGWAEFCGLRIAVDRGVFVPRRRTEFLVRQAASLAPPTAVIVDLCCGSGAVGRAVVGALDSCEVHACDVDALATACARRNLLPLGGHVYDGDLYAALPAHLRGRVDVLVANAPYVPSDEVRLLPREARLHEPLVALDGGNDGIELHRRIAAAAPVWLKARGHLVVETSDRQAELTAEVFVHSGLDARVARCDDWDATVVIGTNTAPRDDH
jgi:release factor glutamine methyltransferase